MPSLAFTWNLFVREATEAARFVFGTGSYDLSDPGSQKQLGAIFMLFAFTVLGIMWMFTDDGFGRGGGHGSGGRGVAKKLVKLGRVGRFRDQQGLGSTDVDRRAPAESPAQSAPYVLGYWNTRALAEPVRLLLSYSGVPWTDKRYQVGAPPQYDKTEWYSEKDSLGLAFPNLPYLIQPSTGLKITQTRTILRHLSNLHGPQCTSLEHQVRADMVCEFLFDWWADMFRVTYCDFPGEPLSDMSRHQGGQLQCISGGQRFDSLLKAYLTGKLPACLARMATFLSETPAPAWIAGRDLSYADFVLFELLDTHLLLAPSCLREHPDLEDYRRRFLALAPIAAYRAGGSVPAFRPEPIHNRYSHFHTGWQARGSFMLEERDDGTHVTAADKKLQ
jgi:glutathione S-transferase